MMEALYVIVFAALVLLPLEIRGDWWRKSPVNQPHTIVGRILGRFTMLSLRNIYKRLLFFPPLFALAPVVFLFTPVALAVYAVQAIFQALWSLIRMVAGRPTSPDLESHGATVLTLVGLYCLARGLFILMVLGLMNVVPSALYYEVLGGSKNTIPFLLWNPWFAWIDGIIGLLGALTVALFLVKDLLRRSWQIRQLENLPTSTAAAAAVGVIELRGKAMPVSEGEEMVLRYQSPPFYQPVARPADSFITFRPFFLEDPSGRILVDPTGFRLRNGLFSGIFDIDGVNEIVLTRRVTVNDEEDWVARELRSGDPLYAIGRAVVSREADGLVLRPAPRPSFRQSLRRFLFGQRSLNDVFFVSDTDEVTAGKIMRRTRSAAVAAGLLWVCCALLVAWSGANAGRQLARWQDAGGAWTTPLDKPFARMMRYLAMTRVDRLGSGTALEKARVLVMLTRYAVDAEQVFPQVALLVDDPDPIVREAAWHCLREIHASSPEAMAFYRSRLAHERYPYSVVQILEQMGPQAKPFVSVLVAILMDPKEERFRKELAMRTLGSIGPEAKDAVPSLAVLMQAEKRQDRDSAYRALLRILGPSPSAVLHLVRILEREPWDMNNSEDLNLRRDIFRALGEIGPPAAPAVTYLIQQLERGYWYSESIVICRTLGSIGPEAKDALPLLEKLAGTLHIEEAKDAIRKIRGGKNE